MRTPGFFAAASLTNSALARVAMPTSLVLEDGELDPVIIGSGDIPPINISSECVINCQNNCAAFCAGRPNPLRCFVNRCITNCALGCVGT
jgi:hypothetical protein